MKGQEIGPIDRYFVKNEPSENRFIVQQVPITTMSAHLAHQDRPA